MNIKYLFIAICFALFSTASILWANTAQHSAQAVVDTSSIVPQPAISGGTNMLFEYKMMLAKIRLAT